MNDTITTYPELVTEILRYDTPQETYRFYTIVPHEVSFQHLNQKPFSDPSLLEKRVQVMKARADGDEELLQKVLPQYVRAQGPNYIETEKHQVNAEKAELIRLALLDEGYAQYAYIDLPIRAAVVRVPQPGSGRVPVGPGHPTTRQSSAGSGSGCEVICP